MARYEVITQVRKNSPYTRTFAEASSLAELNARLSSSDAKDSSAA